MEWIGELGGFVTGFFQSYPYLGPFLVLLSCGVGLPLPEEFTLIASGVFLHSGGVEFWRITGTCGAAILLGDSIPFWLGRRYGMSALKIRWIRRIIHPERFAKLETRFGEHGNWATFACRFFAGVRIPGYFLAGTLRMSYPRFLLLDTLGVLVSVPISIWFGKVFGENIERLRHRVHHLHLALAILVVGMAVVLLVRARLRRSSRKAADAAAAAAARPSSEIPPPID